MDFAWPQNSAVQALLTTYTHCLRGCVALACRGLEYIDKSGGKHSAVASWSFVAADGVEMPLEEGTSCFM